ncbi:hypothetical protein IJS77_00495 [bacterium]|nr:hypothetical protein [bacterium]
MKKTLLFSLLFIIVLFFGIKIFADSATKCANGYEPITHKINDATNEKLCYNEQTGLSYYIKKGGSNSGKLYFFKDWWYCGINCNFDGTNCEKDFCSASYCNQKEGYTQIKHNKGVRFICYNPDTKMGYYPNPESKNEKHQYYINNLKCGEDCDINGTNCRVGYCNPSYCDKENGYTQIKELEKSYGCYNPKTHISYTFGMKFGAKKDFYINDKFCGSDCDSDGKNCSYGNTCSAAACETENGYTEIKDSACYNPSTHISYSGNEFYLNGKLCGYDCDINGRNCKTGACYADECNRKYGYPEIKDDKCYNPKTFLSFDHYLGKRFYYKSKVCGRNCDMDGRNCKPYGGKRGVCNVDDCPNGYKQIVDVLEYDAYETGLCKQENGNKLLLLRENNKFQDYNLYKIKEKTKFGAGVLLTPTKIFYPYDN